MKCLVAARRMHLESEENVKIAALIFKVNTVNC